MTTTLLEDVAKRRSGGKRAFRKNMDANLVSPNRVLSDEMLSGDIVKELVELFKLLSDETRLKILYLLQKQKEINVRGLCQILKQSQPAVSHHLALLRVAGLIEMRREGKHNYYRLLPERFQELMKLMFTASPGAVDEIRFDDFVLSMNAQEV